MDRLLKRTGAKGLFASRRAWTGVLLLLFGCSIGPSKEGGHLLELELKDEEKRAVLYEELEGTEGVLRILPPSSEKDASVRFVVKAGKLDSLSELFASRREEGNLKNIRSVSGGHRADGGLASGNVPDSEKKPTIDLPHIFDFFTRIY